MSNLINKVNMFKAIERRVPLCKIVTQQIEESIMSKQYLPGAKLPTETELSKQFGVSRTAIREALQTLSARNLITVTKGKGIFVNEMKPSSITEPLNKYLVQKLDRNYMFDLLHSRQIIEPALAEAAALKRTQEDIDILVEDLEILSDFEGDFKSLAKFDMHFHLDIARASKNNFLPLILEPVLMNMMPEVKSFIYETVADARDDAYANHKEILEAIIAGDSGKAKNAMMQHLKIAETNLEKMLEVKYGVESTEQV